MVYFIFQPIKTSEIFLSFLLIFVLRNWWRKRLEKRLLVQKEGWNIQAWIFTFFFLTIRVHAKPDLSILHFVSRHILKHSFFTSLTSSLSIKQYSTKVFTYIWIVVVHCFTKQEFLFDRTLYIIYLRFKCQWHSVPLERNMTSNYIRDRGTQLSNLDLQIVEMGYMINFS